MPLTLLSVNYTKSYVFGFKVVNCKQVCSLCKPKVDEVEMEGSQLPKGCQIESKCQATLCVIINLKSYAHVWKN
jgi:hypothetical protein